MVNTDDLSEEATVLLERINAQRPADVPPNWHEHLVLVWEEDDASRAAHDITRERLSPSWSGGVGAKNGSRQGAWSRITGRRWEEEPLDTYDVGDAIYHIYPGGWVRCWGLHNDALYLAVTVATVQGLDAGSEGL